MHIKGEKSKKVTSETAQTRNRLTDRTPVEVESSMYRMKLIIAIISSLLVLPHPSVILASEKDFEDRLGYAARLFHDSSYSKAVNELKAIYREAGGSETALEASYLLGMTNKVLGDWKEAANWLELSSKDYNLADYAMFSLGEVHLSAGNYQLAIDAFLDLQARFPESRWREDAGFKVSETLALLGRYIESRSSFEKFIKGTSDSRLIPSARIRMAEVTEKIEGSREAYNYYKYVWLNYPISPESKTATERMAQIALNETVPAPSLEERYNRVCNLFSRSSFREGTDELLPLLKEAEADRTDVPKWYPEALLKLGNAYYQLREDGKTAAILKKLCGITDSQKILEEALFLSGKALQRSGNREEATAIFESMRRDYPKGGFLPRVAFRLAGMTEDNGEIMKARDMYRNIYLDFPDSNLADDALWKEGWLNYSEKDYQGAYSCLKKLTDEYPSSEFAESAAYWSTRASEKIWKSEETIISGYTDIVRKSPSSYYAFLARGRISSIAPERPIPSRARTAPYASRNEQKTPDNYTSFHLKRGKTLLSLGFREDAVVELSIAEAGCKAKGALLEIARLLTAAGEYHRAKRIALSGFQELLSSDIGFDETEIWALAFPAGFSDYVRINAGINSLDPYLIHAIIREESSYNPDAVSRAGAIGLMQLMPGTVRSLSKDTGFKGYEPRSLFNPPMNINLGSLYLKKLIEDNKGNIPLALASYNAGPSAVTAWISKYGTGEIDEFIEKIPYQETRSYVKKVMRSYKIYERLYGLNESGVSWETAFRDSGSFAGSKEQ